MAAIEPLAPEDTVWLGEYLSVLRRRKWSILLVTLLAVAGAVLYGKQQTPIYQSNARVVATTVLQTQQGAQAPNMETEQSFVTSDDVTKCAYQMIRPENTAFRTNPTVIPDLDTLCSADELAKVQLTGPVRALQQNLTITITSPSTVMTIGYLSPSVHAAQAGAQAFALAYIHERVAQADVQLNQLRAPLLATQKNLTK